MDLTKKLGLVVMSYQKTIYHRDGRIYCTMCNQRKDVTDKEYKQIKYSKMCPMCYNELNKVKEYTEPVQYLDYVNEGDKGYEVRAAFSFDHTEFSRKHVVTFMSGYKLVKDVYISGMSYTARIRPMNPLWHGSKMGKWRKTKAMTYDYVMLSANHMTDVLSKKEWLNNNAAFITKSNQKKLIMDNLFSSEQITAISVFDLKRAEDVYRYRGWIRKNLPRWAHTTSDFNLNVTHLRYLSKNKIKLTDYLDYGRACKDINRKLDKPKDFMLWHDRIVQMREEKRNEKYVEGIKEQFKKLERFELKTKKYEIRTFSDYDQIRIVSQSLHNCMSRLYVERFSEGRDELWHLDVDGKPVVAIEVRDGELVQCRGDYNMDPPANLTRAVKKWLKGREEWNLT